MPWRTVRVGVTGLARAGKTAFLTSVAANLLALGAGRAVLPEVTKRLAGRPVRIGLADRGASAAPRFGHQAHMEALLQEPPAWPERTDAVSLLALDMEVGRGGLAGALPAQRVRLEFLDYPGEWLLDLPLLRVGYAAWSERVLRRLEGRAEATAFLAFLAGLPADAGRDEALARHGHGLYRRALQEMRAAGMSMLQPGRFLMPTPGPEPGWMEFFPMRGRGGLQELMRQRYEAYVEEVGRSLSDPLFGQVDRLVVLVDLLTALGDGAAAFAEVQAALAEASGALRWERSVLETVAALGRFRMPPPVVSRVVFAATKADHIAARQRGNLAALLRRVAMPAEGAGVRAAYVSVAAVRCTEDIVWTLEGRPVSAVRGRVAGDERLVRSYPGEVPDSPPDGEFWGHPFLALPDFEPMRPPRDGRGGCPNLGLGGLLVALLDDVL